MSLTTHLGADWQAVQRDKKSPQEAAVTIDFSRTTNPHLLMCGMSGAGKTYSLKKMIRQMTRHHPAPRIHILDVHGDIDMPASECSEVVFSESMPYGLNPLTINPDPHSGGVRKRIQSTIAIIESTLGKLGNKQQAVLRNIMLDTYKRFGFDVDDPATWDLSKTSGERLIDESQNRLYIDVPYDEKSIAQTLGARWDGTVKSWYVPIDGYKGELTQWPQKRRGTVCPTLQDVLSEAKQVLRRCFFGSANEKAINALQAAHATARTLKNKQIKTIRAGGETQLDDTESAELDKARERAIGTYTEYVNSVVSGKELDNLLKYDSVDVLKSVVDRLENLLGYGIFREKAPPFDPHKTIWRYNMANLGTKERKLFALFKMQELFEETRALGEQSQITDIIIADEAHIYQDDDNENPMNSIAKESRKFGLALWCASQNPTHFTEDFISCVATKIILGVDEMYWKKLQNTMRIPEDYHKKMVPQRIILAQIKNKGEVGNDWCFVALPREQDKAA